MMESLEILGISPIIFRGSAWFHGGSIRMHLAESVVSIPNGKSWRLGDLPMHLFDRFECGLREPIIGAVSL